MARSTSSVFDKYHRSFERPYIENKKKKVEGKKKRTVQLKIPDNTGHTIELI